MGAAICRRARSEEYGEGGGKEKGAKGVFGGVLSGLLVSQKQSCVDYD